MVVALRQAQPSSRAQAEGGAARVGVLGGTFDPVHVGHLIIAEDVQCRLGLGKVLFIPTGWPWLKADNAISPAHHRVAMARLAIASNPAFELDTLEVDRPGPSYSVDTLEALHASYPPGAEFYFVIGWDLLGQLPQWHRPARLLELCHLVAVPRPGYRRSLRQLEGLLPGITSRVIALDWPRLGISASEIRRRRAQGLSIRYLVPPAVLDYIEAHRLYLDSASAPSNPDSVGMSPSKGGGP